MKTSQFFSWWLSAWFPVILILLPGNKKTICIGSPDPEVSEDVSRFSLGLQPPAEGSRTSPRKKTGRSPLAKCTGTSGWFISTDELQASWGNSVSSFSRKLSSQARHKTLLIKIKISTWRPIFSDVSWAVGHCHLNYRILCCLLLLINRARKDLSLRWVLIYTAAQDLRASFVEDGSSKGIN